ncbi:MAG: ribosomal protein S18-alanine N-acetyltransferase [Pseudomonadota bacterium]
MNAVLRLPTFGLRVMEVDDLSAVMEIEYAAYEFPWSEGIFRDCMRVGYGCWVYQQDGVIQAYGVMSVAAGDCHILNLCVKPQQQGRGLGRRILAKILNLARLHDANTAILEVRPSNRRAVSLYLSAGFNEVGRRKRYYPARKGREDALILAKVL